MKRALTILDLDGAYTAELARLGHTDIAPGSDTFQVDAANAHRPDDEEAVRAKCTVFSRPNTDQSITALVGRVAWYPGAEMASDEGWTRDDLKASNVAVWVAAGVAEISTDVKRRPDVVAVAVFSRVAHHFVAEFLSSEWGRIDAGDMLAIDLRIRLLSLPVPWMAIVAPNLSGQDAAALGEMIAQARALVFAALAIHDADPPKARADGWVAS